MVANCLAGLPLNRDEMTQWVVLCVGILATAYLVMRGRAKRRRDPMERAGAGGGMGVSQQRQIERDISNLVVEMLETARQMTGQLDMRATRLELLIGEADARLAELQAAVGRPAAVSIANEGAELPAVAEGVVVEMKPEQPPDPRHAEIYEMADQGRSPGEIARSLNRPNGEVELILALRRG